MIYFLELLLAGCLGAIFGSYATLFIHRLPINKSCFGRYFGEKSNCPNCKKIIKTRELIPIINWIVTLGKCSNCNIKIPKKYLLTELSSACLFVICYNQYGLNEIFIINCLIIITLLIALIIDFEHKFIPNQVIVTILLFGSILRVLIDQTILNLIFTATIGIAVSTIFYKIFFSYRKFILQHKQAFNYGLIIIMTSITLQPKLFLIYSIFVIFVLSLYDIWRSILNKDTTYTGLVIITPFIFFTIFN